MSDTGSQSQNELAGGKSRTGRLASKVVLLIGNDPGVLHPLAIKFAAKGSDIVLASSQLPADTTSAIREHVQALDSRFLLIDNELDNGTMEKVVSKVRDEMGGIDILIDMSARDSRRLAGKTKGEIVENRLWLSEAILEEIGS